MAEDRISVIFCCEPGALDEREEIDMAEVVERIVSRYYHALEEGRILGRRCPVCGNIEWPPVYACNECGCMDTEWYELSGNGEIMICLVPTVMSSRPAYSDLEPYGYCAVKCEEGPERNVMVLNVTKNNAKYIREHLPYPVHMEIVERDGYKTAVFAIDPIKADGSPDLELIGKREKKKLDTADKGMNGNRGHETAQADIPDEPETDPEIFEALAKIVADAYKVDVSEITPQTSFEGEFKASSIVFVGIVAMIEEEFGVFMSITEASGKGTVGRLAAAIQQLLEEEEG